MRESFNAEDAEASRRTLSLTKHRHSRESGNPELPEAAAFAPVHAKGRLWTPAFARVTSNARMRDGIVRIVNGL
jgi:hypothetical protein